MKLAIVGFDTAQRPSCAAGFLLGFKGSHDFPKFLLFFGRSRPGAQKLNVVQISGLLGEREYIHIHNIYVYIYMEREIEREVYSKSKK